MRIASFYDGMMRVTTHESSAPGRAVLWLVIVLAGCAAAKPPSSKPMPVTTQPATLSPAAALSQAVSMLMREGRQAKAQQKFPRERADFAATYPGKPDPEALGARLVRTASDDPFIDGYVRWQLTSFNPVLPEMDDSQFERMLSVLPALVDNPRADSVLMAEMSAGVRGGTLSKPAQDQMSRRIKQAEQRTVTVESFTRAPLGFREWLRAQVPQSGTRPVLLAIEECHAIIIAKWNGDAAKQRLESLVTAASTNQNLGADDLQLIRDSLAGLIGLRALYVRSAEIQNNVLVVDYAETAIDDFELRRWMKLIKSPSNAE